MQITQRTPKFSLIIISLLILLWIAHKFGAAIVDGEVRVIYLTMGLSILIMLPYIIEKIGTSPLFCGLICIYWLPFDSRMGCFSPFLVYMYPAEFGMWMLCLGIVIHGSVSRSAQFNSAVGRFPFLPFVLLVVGSLTANLVSGNLFARSELGQIRILCFLPAVICFLCLYFIKTVKQAERLLWIFLISAGLLGLVYLFAPNISHSFGSVAEETGRIRRIIKLPLFGVLNMTPGGAGACFAFIIALSFNLWLNHPSFRGRLIAAAVLAISALVIIRGQARTATIATTCSVIAIQALSLRFNYSPRSFWRMLFKPAILIFTFLFSIWYFASVSKIVYFRQHGLSLFTDPLDAVSGSPTSSSRMNMWKAAVDVVLDNPLGVGIWGYPSVDGLSWIAHNLYLFVLLSFGIIGFIGFFWFFLRYTKACWSGLHSNSLNRRLLCIAGMGCVTTLFVEGIGSPIFWSPWSTLMGWIPIGITLAVATLPERDGSQ